MNKIKGYLERAKQKALSVKGNINRKKIMNFLGVYVDEDSEEEVVYEDILTEMFYGLLLKLYGLEEDEECEQYEDSPLYS